MITIEHTYRVTIRHSHSSNTYTHFVGFINYRQTFFFLQNRKHNRHMPVTVMAIVAVCILYSLYSLLYADGSISFRNMLCLSHSCCCCCCSMVLKPTERLNKSYNVEKLSRRLARWVVYININSMNVCIFGGFYG